MNKVTVINIQKYSIHDGPGIRTTVFLKGCPLNCWWCHNPESQNPKQEIMFFKERCTGCGACAKACPESAIKMIDGYPVLDKDKCILCGKCTDFCIKNARVIVGKEYTVKELMKEIQKDEIFYEESGGGVTFSGGEPLLHADFLSNILEECKVKKIHTTIDTSGCVAWENIEKVLDKVDLFLYDIKAMDDEVHKKYIGVSNNIILENLKKLSSKGANIFVRMPIVKGVNDDDEQIKKAAEFLANLNIIQVNLLPYHKMGMDKYRRLEMEYKLTGLEKPSDERMDEIAEVFKKSGIKVKIGG